MIKIFVNTRGTKTPATFLPAICYLLLATWNIASSRCNWDGHREWQKYGKSREADPSSYVGKVIFHLLAHSTNDRLSLPKTVVQYRKKCSTTWMLCFAHFLFCLLLYNIFFRAGGARGNFWLLAFVVIINSYMGTSPKIWKIFRVILKNLCGFTKKLK